MSRMLYGLCGTAVFAVLAFAAAPAFAQPAVGLTPGGDLVRFDTDAPGTVLERHTITGLQAGEQVMGIDVRPATGQLYALGIVRAVNDTGRIYVIDPGTGAATEVGTAPFKTDLVPSEYGFDFNPVVDKIRVVNRGDQNMRVNPTDGTLVQSDNNLTPAGDVDALAYDQNVSGTPQTTLWGYDSGVDKVVRIGGVNGGPPDGSPNNGTVVAPFGASGVSTAGRSEMDISSGGRAFLTAQTAPTAYGLYTVNLTGGTLTLVGSFPEAVEDLALLPPSTFEIDGRFITVTEDGVNAMIEVRRSGNSSGTQTIAYSTANGTADGSDYTAQSGTLTFGPGVAVTGFNVPIVDDNVDEPAESFTVSLSAPTGGAQLGTTPSTEVTIIDNDPPRDTTKPRLLLSVPPSLKSRQIAGGLAGSFSCSERCTTSFTMKLGRATLGSAKATIAAAGVKRFKVKLSSKGKKALRTALVRRPSATLSLSARGKDPAGNVGTAKARVTVTR